MKRSAFIMQFLLLFYAGASQNFTVFHKKNKAGITIAGYEKEVILPASYDKITIHEKFAILVIEKQYILFDILGRKVLRDNLDEIILDPVPKRTLLFLLRKNNQWSYFQENYRTLEPWYDSIRFVPDLLRHTRTCIFLYHDNKIGLDLTQGYATRLVLPPVFSSIQKIEEALASYFITSLNGSGARSFTFIHLVNKPNTNKEFELKTVYLPQTFEEIATSVELLNYKNSPFAFKENNKWGLGKFTDTSLIRLTASYFDSIDKSSLTSSPKGYYKGKLLDALSYPSLASLDWKTEFDELKVEKDGYVIVTQNRKLGLYLKDDKLLPPEYDRIDRIRNSALFVVKSNKGFHLFDASRKNFFGSKVYNEIRVFEPESFLVMRHDGKDNVYLFREEKWLTSEGYDQVTFAGPIYFLLKNKRTIKVFDLNQNKVVHTLTADTAYRINSKYLVSRNGDEFQLLDLANKTSRLYTKILAWKGYYVLFQNKMADLLFPDGKIQSFDEATVFDECISLKKDFKTSLLLISGPFISLKQKESFYGMAGNCYVINEGLVKGLLDAEGNRLLHCAFERIEFHSMPKNAKHPTLNLTVPRYRTFTSSDYSLNRISFYNRDCDKCSGSGTVTEIVETKPAPIYSTAPGTYYENGVKKYGTYIVGYTKGKRETVRKQCNDCKGKGALFIQFKWDGNEYVPVK